MPDITTLYDWLVISINNLPPSRLRALALTALEESELWYDKAHDQKENA